MLSIFLLFTVRALTVHGQLVIKARTLLYAAEAAVIPHKLPYVIAMLTDKAFPPIQRIGFEFIIVGVTLSAITR
jgi:hypothetical protein